MLYLPRRPARAHRLGDGLRPALRSIGFDDAGLDQVVEDALADPAIGNSPRLPTIGEARAILAAVAG